MTGAYEIRCLPGNHGTWLFVLKDGQTIFEQSGLTEEEAQAMGARVIASDKNLPEINPNSKWNIK